MCCGPRLDRLPFLKKRRNLEVGVREDLSVISRYRQRKNYEEAEANAIGTEYVRADLLPADDATRVRSLLRKYLDERILFYNARDEQQLRQINGENLLSKYKKRFVRYRNSIFTFLGNDGIPWNNNAAERALRHLAVQRKISGAFSEKGARRYLRLLAISQTCRFQNKSFLGFLLSGLKDVNLYERKRCQHSLCDASLEID